MTAQTATLTDFLLARIAEDEGNARRAAWGWGSGWRSYAKHDDWWSVEAEGKRDMVGSEDGDVTQHIARHDPARVLAECEAKRRIVEAVDPSQIEFWMAQNLGIAGPLLETWQIATLRALALPYADHPEFRPEWRA